MTIYTIMTKVKKVERKDRTLRSHVEDGQTIQEKEDLGWFVLFEGSRESISFGPEEPDLRVGQSVNIRIESV